MTKQNADTELKRRQGAVFEALTAVGISARVTAGQYDTILISIDDAERIVALLREDALNF